MRGAVAALALGLMATRPAASQARPEARVEGVRTSAWRVETGIGLTTALGNYLRGGISVARDVWRERADTARWRVDGLLRFLSDPLAEHPWGLAVGGGLGYRDGAYLLAALELEGPRLGTFRPALRLALGGGSRFALIVRRAAPERR